MGLSLAMQYDKSYLRSLSGILKLSCLLYQLAALFTICLSSVSTSNARARFYICVALLSILCTGIILVMRIFTLWQRAEIIYELNLPRYEAYLATCLSLITFFASAFTLTLDVVSYTIVAFFGFIACCCYIWDGYVNYSLSLKCDATTQTENVIHV